MLCPVSLQEDFLESEKEMPIESTFVRIKETPLEQESKILVVTENGACAYTVNHDTSHPPPPKVFVCDTPESVKGACVDGSRSLADSSSDFVHRIIDQVFQGSPGKMSSPGEPPLESSILATRKDGRRSNSLPIKKTVHFEVDLYKDASCSKDPLYSPDLRFEGSLQAAKGPATEDKQQVAKAPEVASNGVPEDASVAAGFLSSSQPSQSSSPCDDVMESPANPGKESHSPPPPTEDSLTDSPLQIQVEQQLAVEAVEAVDRDDSFDSVPLKTSKFNRDLVEFASTSQTFSEGSSPPEKAPAGDEGAESHEDKTGKRRAKSACKRKEPSECPEEASDHDPPREAGPEAPSSSLAPEEAVVRKTEVYEKAKRKSICRRRHSGEEEEEEEEKEAEGQQGADAELPSNPASSSVSLETLGTPSKERMDFAPSPPLSKVSVIPHDLFYYPHYEVPLAAVLEAYAEGVEDLKMEEVDLEEPEEAYLHDPEPRRQAEGSPNSCNFSGPGVSSLGPGPDRDASPALDPAPPDPHEDHQPRATEKSDPVQSQQVPEVRDFDCWEIFCLLASVV